MSQLQKKCLLASTSMHGLLLLILVVGSAFFVAEEKHPPHPPIRVIPTKLIDGETSGGGNPNIPITSELQRGNPAATAPRETEIPKPPIPRPAAPKPPVPTPPAPQIVVKPPPPRPQPKRIEAVVKPPVVKPPKESPLAEVKRPTPKVETEPKKELAPIQVSAAEIAAANEKARADAAARDRAAANQRIARNLGKAIEELQSGFSAGTAVVVGGDGGEAMANYADFVKAIYDDAWGNPDILMDDRTTTRVVVTIGRNGRVLSSQIERRSGNPSLDRSVQRTLDRVKFVRPFPAETKDEQRTFYINFNLKAKQSAG